MQPRQERADWYAAMVRGRAGGLDRLAADTAVELAGRVWGRSVLDAAAGEGTLARTMAAGGARVTACESTPSLLALARASEARQPLGIRYLAEPVDALGGVATGSVDVAVAVLALHQVEDLAGALAGLRRTLSGGGRLIIVVPHPWTDHPGCHQGFGGRVLGNYGEEGAWRSGECEPVRWAGWFHRTLETWFEALTTARFVVDGVREPLVEPSETGTVWERLPRFLALRALAAGPV